MIARLKGALLQHVGIPLYAPVHRRKLRRWQTQMFPLVDAIARESRRRSAGPLILIARHEHMGDVLMASAAVRHLRRLHPDATLVFATQRRFRELVAHNPRLDHVIDCQCIGSVLALAEHPAFDQGHVLAPHGTYCELCGAVYHDPYPRHLGQGVDRRPWFFEGRHLVELMFERLGCEGADMTPEIHVPADIRARMQARLRSLVPADAAFVVAMHTTTPHWPAKQWPAENFAALMRHATMELHAQVIVLGSERVTALPAGVIDLTGQTSMLESAVVLEGANVFVGLDSGPSHLASAVGTPSVLLFGPTNPANCQPLGRKVTVLWHGCAEDGLFTKALRPGTRANRDIAKITVEEVMGAIRRMMAAAVLSNA